MEYSFLFEKFLVGAELNQFPCFHHCDFIKRVYDIQTVNCSDHRLLASPAGYHQSLNSCLGFIVEC